MFLQPHPVRGEAAIVIDRLLGRDCLLLCSYSESTAFFFITAVAESLIVPVESGREFEKTVIWDTVFRLRPKGPLY